MNPLKLDRINRTFYEALLDLHTTNLDNDCWLDKYRRVKKIKQVEGRNVIKGWKCFYVQYGKGLPVEVAEMFF